MFALEQLSARLADIFGLEKVLLVIIVVCAEKHQDRCD